MPGKIKDNKSISDSYDNYPYESYPFPHARPDYIRSIGMVFGMQPPAIETARILELGCAAGGNIINLAESYPKSYTLGIDLSKVEIEHGQKVIKELGLKNIELKHQSITELDESMEKFDYIICHGVFSWVPDFVRDKILDLSKKLLSQDGIAYISYNTLPGWNMNNTIRDMMLFHSEIFEDVDNKVNQAKLFLNFINESLEGTNTPYANFLKEETEGLRHRDNSYLKHEYLAEENTQFYFRDFAKLAADKGLSYVGEANLPLMYLGNLPEKVSEKLAAIGDIIRTEQYMDFIQNRRFRCTLLTHNNAKLNRNISGEIINKFYLSCSVVPEKPKKEADIANPLESIKFFLRGSDENNINTSSPVMKAVLYAFIENEGNPLTADELLKAAQKKLPSATLENFMQEFSTINGRLLFTGYMKIFASKPQATAKISSKPKVSGLVRYQVQNLAPNKAWVTTQINSVFGLQPHEKYVLEKLDGKHTQDQLIDFVFENFENGNLTASSGENKVEDKAALKELAKQCVIQGLERFRTNYLLIG